MTTVVDASVVVDWVAPDLAADAPALQLLARLGESGEEVVVPRLLFHEVANALVTGIRRKRWSGREADAAYLALASLPVLTVDDPRDADRAYELARRFDEHPVYDMVYFAIAQRLGATVVTADRRFLQTVGRHPLVLPL